MEKRRSERRRLTRGYGPDRRVSELPIAGLDLRHNQRRRKDRRQSERRQSLFTLFAAEESASE
jgi:hypothetical protein